PFVQQRAAVALERLTQGADRAAGADGEAVAGHQQAAGDVARDARKHLAQIVGGQRIGVDTVTRADPLLERRAGGGGIRLPPLAPARPAGSIRVPPGAKQFPASNPAFRGAARASRRRSPARGPRGPPGSSAAARAARVESTPVAPPTGRADRAASPEPCATC